MSEPTPGNGSRRRLLLVLATIVVLGAAVYGAWWWLHGQYHEFTDDAYVAGHVVQITAQTAGTVVYVGAEETDSVRAGQTLLRLDPADARVALEQAEAVLARKVREVRGLYSGDASAAAEVARREADLARARDDLARRQRLAGTGAITGEEIEHARQAVGIAEAAATAARETRRSGQALVAGTEPANQPAVSEAAAKVQEACLAWLRSVIPAPVDGVVGRRAVQLGQRITAGTPVMGLVPLGGVWVDANFKEGQLRHMRLGQPVSLTSDLYGGKLVYRGRIAGFAPGTGSAFALLPAQNATGNWIKIVQRLPVRIALDPAELAQHPLRVGLSMLVDIDTHDRNGQDLGEGDKPATTSRTDVYVLQENLARERAQAVISAALKERGPPALPADPLSQLAAVSH